MSTGKICNEEKHVLFVNRKEGDLATESIPLQDSPTAKSHRREAEWEAGLTSHYSAIAEMSTNLQPEDHIL